MYLSTTQTKQLIIKNKNKAFSIITQQIKKNRW
jgi:hypothetical protein